MNAKVRVDNEVKVQVSKVVTTWDVEEANRLLKTGYVLLHGGMAHKDDFGYCAKPCFILGKKGGQQ